MNAYSSMPGVDSGVISTTNSADIRGNLRLRLAVGGNEAGILVEEAGADGEPRFVAIYFATAGLERLIGHLQAMQEEYEALRRSEHEQR
jgi:hypothetical protein